MKDLSKTSELNSHEAADTSHVANTTELGPDDLAKVSGGCAAGAHYKTVVLEMRKAGGDPQSAGKPF